MIHVLHLLDSEADFQTRYCANMVARKFAPAFHFTQLTVGCGGDLPRRLNAIRLLNRSDKQFDILHTWGSKALGIAGMGWSRGLVHTPAPECDKAIPHGGYIRVVRAAPGVEYKAGVNLREQLGFVASDFVVIAPGESTEAAAHDLALWSVLLCHELDESFKLLIWGRGNQSAKVTRFASALRRGRALCVAESALGKQVEFDSIVSSADLALLTARPNAAKLGPALCMAAGLPTIRLTTPTPRAAAQQILEMRNQPKLLEEARRASLRTAAEQYSVEKFLETYRSAYTSKFLTSNA